MKRKLLPGLLLLVGCGCSTMNNTEKGAVTGGAIGAGGGALLGSAVHAPLAGALVGGTVGALVGGVAGSNADRAEAHDKAVQQAVAQQVNAPPNPSLEQVVAMKQQNLGDTVIINAIRQSPGGYYLTAEQAIWLKQNGINDVIISEMQAHGPRVGAPPGTVYVIDGAPPPPPPVAVGIRYGYYRRW
jgi:hypothetical protein